MLDADAEINNSSQKVGGSNAYPDPAHKKVGGSGPRKHIVSTPCVETASPGTIWYCLLVAFLPAQRHASMGTSYGPVSVGLCLSQVGILLKQMNELSCFFVRKLPSTSPALCLNRNSGISKNKGTPSGTQSETPDLENFVMAYRSSKHVIDFARQRWDSQSVINGPSSVNYVDNTSKHWESTESWSQ